MQPNQGPWLCCQTALLAKSMVADSISVLHKNMASDVFQDYTRSGDFDEDNGFYVKQFMGEGVSNDVDCVGRWSDCTDACEPGGQRTFIEETASVGGGITCDTWQTNNHNHC